MGLKVPAGSSHSAVRPVRPGKAPAAAGPTPHAGRPAAQRRAAAGAAPKRQSKTPLKALGLEDPRLALLCTPTEYLDCRTAHTSVQDAPLDTPGTLFELAPTGRARGFSRSRSLIWSIPSAPFPHGGAIGWNLLRGTHRSEFDLEDAEGGVVRLSVFGGHKPWLDMPTGQPLLMLGELKQMGKNLYFSCQRIAPAAARGRVWARYTGNSLVSGDKIERLVAAAWQDETSLRACTAHIVGATGLPEAALLEACQTEDGAGFGSIEELLVQLHKPDSMEGARLALDSARRLTAMAIQAAAIRHHHRPPHPQAPLAVRPGDLQPLQACLKLPLTADQKTVAHGLVSAFADPTPLTALLSGDVGTGKTLAFLLPALAAHRAGARVAIITPRLLLADQIAQEILSKFGSVVTKLERVEASGTIFDPSSVLVGTSGLATVARRCGYVPQVLICDEQHKFSTAEREALVGPYTHLVEVSATPVPRSLAASLYEGMRIFNLRQCPVDKHIESEVLDMSRRADVVARIREALSKGERAAVVYPQVNLSEDDAQADKSNSVLSAFASLSQAFPGQAVMLHGDMDDAETRANIAMLRSGERKLVVASTVLEIGIDIPSVSLMVVRDADRFGISQLHQLRGRLARNGGHGRFMMVVEDEAQTPPDALARLESVAATNDGYELAEIDLLQRGFGDVDGQAQSGQSRTLFRMVRLGPADFMKRKLRSGTAQLLAELSREQLQRPLAMEDPGRRAPVQERLL